MKHNTQASGRFLALPLALLAVAFVALVRPTPAQQSGTKSLKIQDGTVVHVIFTEELSSEKNKPEDQVKCEVAEDVKVGDVVVIAKGTPATGKVSQAEKRGGWGKSGTLVYSLDYAKSADGGNVRLRAGSAQ